MSEKELQDLKDTIKEKYGSYSSFCRAAKMDRYEFQRDFLQGNPPDSNLVAKINSLVGRLNPKTLRPKLTATKIKGLRTQINECGGVIEFCRLNPQFKKETVYQILVGRYPTVTGTVKGLLDHFGL